MNEQGNDKGSDALPERVLWKIKAVSEKVMDASLLEADLTALAQSAYNEGVIAERLRTPSSAEALSTADDSSPFGLVLRLKKEADKWSGTSCRSEEQFYLRDMLREAARCIERHVVAEPVVQSASTSTPADQIPMAKGWIEAAGCENCGGQGWTARQVGSGDWEQEQCQWCFEKWLALGQPNAVTDSSTKRSA